MGRALESGVEFGNTPIDDRTGWAGAAGGLEVLGEPDGFRRRRRGCLNGYKTPVVALLQMLTKARELDRNRLSGISHQLFVWVAFILIDPLRTPLVVVDQLSMVDSQ